MKICVTAKPNSKHPRIEKISETEFVVAVKEPPVQGKANRAIVQALSEYFNVPAAHIRFISGFTSRHKIVEIQNLTT